MLCQVCGAVNEKEREICARCHRKLFVLSGPLTDEAEDDYEEELDDSISFDEHLLERISVLEEAVKRTAEVVQQIIGSLHKQERSILVNQTGVTALGELLESKRLIHGDEWSDQWNTKMDFQLLVLDKRERFLAVKERILGLHGAGEPRFADALDQAEQALNAFDLDGALRALEDAFRLDKTNYELASFLGETWFNEGDADRALAYYERVLAVRSDHYGALVYGGAILHQRGRGERAEELLTRAVAHYPDEFLPRFSLGAVLAERGKLEHAAMQLEYAVEVDPVPQGLYLLGHCLYEMGKSTTAIEHLRRAVHLDPTFEEAHHLLGLAYLDRRWTRKALGAFRQAQRLNPRRLQYGDLVRFLEGDGGRPLPEVPPEAARWVAAGEEAVSRGDGREALAAHRRALEEAPENPTLLLTYALLCLHLDRGHEIESITRRLLDAEPDEMLAATAYAALIESLRGQGKYREGNRVGRRLLEEGRSSFSQTIAYYEMAFNLAEMEEDLDDALDFARRSVDLSPEELKAFPLAALGWVHFKRRELEPAVEFLSRSSELEPSATTLNHLGMALLASGREDEAKTAFADARRLVPGDDLGAKMMEVMKESTRLLERVRGDADKR